MLELKQTEFTQAWPLLRPFEYSLAIPAAITGNNPGRFFVDDLRHPKTALALTVEGYFLAGKHDNPATNAALGRLFTDDIFSGRVFVNSNKYMGLGVHPQDWAARLPELIPTHEAEPIEAFHYLCREIKFDWRAALPDGYSVRRVDRALLEDPNIVFPPPLDEWGGIEGNWGTPENFYRRAISHCVVHQERVVSWSNCDNVAGDQIEIGIITHPDYRRSGLGAIAAAATVERCLEAGYRSIGWHCSVENTGSWKTAEKVGFKRQRQYNAYFYMIDPVDHLAELGWYHYKQGAYQKTISYYEQVFAQRDQNPDYYYHLTAVAYAELGDAERALKTLQAAFGHGWDDAEYTGAVSAFSILHNNPEWEMLLTKMSQNRSG
ncbi:GNAT family N-acetyltransferase [Chloroflexota bacterium]